MEFKNIKELETQSKDYKNKDFQMDCFYCEAQIQTLKDVLGLIDELNMEFDGCHKAVFAFEAFDELKLKITGK